MSGWRANFAIWQPCSGVSGPSRLHLAFDSTLQNETFSGNRRGVNHLQLAPNSDNFLPIQFVPITCPHGTDSKPDSVDPTRTFLDKRDIFHSHFDKKSNLRFRRKNEGLCKWEWMARSPRTFFSSPSSPPQVESQRRNLMSKHNLLSSFVPLVATVLQLVIWTLLLWGRSLP